MFQGFSQNAIDFLWGISLNNERGWFMDHKQDYQDHLLSPTRALAEQVYRLAQARGHGKDGTQVLLQVLAELSGKQWRAHA